MALVSTCILSDFAKLPVSSLFARARYACVEAFLRPKNPICTNINQGQTGAIISHYIKDGKVPESHSKMAPRLTHWSSQIVRKKISFHAKKKILLSTSFAVDL